jgi:hypothetical protein
MSDRGFLFLFSVLTIIGCLAYCGWVIATGQALTMDGLFMLLTAGLVAAVFGLYVMFMINRELEAQKAAAQPAKPPAPAKAKPAAPAAVTES